MTFPIAGSVELNYQASTFSFGAQHGDVSGGNVVVEVVERTLNADIIRSRVDQAGQDIDRRVAWANADLATFRAESEQSIRRTIATRKERILNDRQVEEALGIPVRASGVARPPVPARRKQVTLETRTAQAAFVPEPVLDEADYQEGLGAVRAWGTSLERTPGTAATLDEEELRDLLLGNLNTYWQGGAGGELFNGSGKTDILIRHGDRNAFVAECKIWRGAKGVSDALDQLGATASLLSSCSSRPPILPRRSRSFTWLSKNTQVTSSRTTRPTRAAAVTTSSPRTQKDVAFRSLSYRSSFDRAPEARARDYLGAVTRRTGRVIVGAVQCLKVALSLRDEDTAAKSRVGVTSCAQFNRRRGSTPPSMRSTGLLIQPHRSDLRFWSCETATGSRPRHLRCRAQATVSLIEFDAVAELRPEARVPPASGGFDSECLAHGPRSTQRRLGIGGDVHASGAGPKRVVSRIDQSVV